MDTKAILGIIAVVGGSALYQVSNWWERAYATYDSSVVSPDGCIRIDTFEPFWVLPSMFHRSPDPDPSIRRSLGRPWEAAIFKRAYEVSTGDLLGETVVFDPVASANLIYWNDTAEPGRRVVFANQFPLADTSRCADAETLARLEAGYEREREANRLRHAAWEKERNADRAASEPFSPQA